MRGVKTRTRYVFHASLDVHTPHASAQPPEGSSSKYRETGRNRTGAARVGTRGAPSLAEAPSAALPLHNTPGVGVGGGTAGSGGVGGTGIPELNPPPAPHKQVETSTANGECAASFAGARSRHLCRPPPARPAAHPPACSQQSKANKQRGRLSWGSLWVFPCDIRRE